MIGPWWSVTPTGERIVWLAEPLTLADTMSEEELEALAEEDRPRRLRPGDSLLVDTKAGYAFERIPKAEVEDLVLEEVPDVLSYPTSAA